MTVACRVSEIYDQPKGKKWQKNRYKSDWWVKWDNLHYGHTSRMSDTWPAKFSWWRRKIQIRESLVGCVRWLHDTCQWIKISNLLFDSSPSFGHVTRPIATQYARTNGLQIRELENGRALKVHTGQVSRRDEIDGRQTSACAYHARCMACYGRIRHMLGFVYLVWRDMYAFCHIYGLPRSHKRHGGVRLHGLAWHVSVLQ